MDPVYVAVCHRGRCNPIGHPRGAGHPTPIAHYAAVYGHAVTIVTLVESMRRSDPVEESARPSDQLRLERRQVLGVRDVRQVGFT